MAGERQDQGEFTIGRGRERDAGAGRSSPHSGSSAPQDERQSGQAEFDLGGTAGRKTASGMPERLRRKYYVAEAGAGDEAKVYADPRGEYLAFKVSTDRMATRLEDAGVIRDMISIAQHRGWREVELRGSEEFRRTTWLDASIRGLSVRGYEPNPVDRAALAFRSKPEMNAGKQTKMLHTREAGASETVSSGGLATKRPIDVTVMPPVTSEQNRRIEGRRIVGQAPLRTSRQAADRPVNESPITIKVLPLRAETPKHAPRTDGQRRAAFFKSANPRQHESDEIVAAARSQLAAIERALTESVHDTNLRRTVLAYAKNEIVERLLFGATFARVTLRERMGQRDIMAGRQSAIEPKSDAGANERTRDR